MKRLNTEVRSERKSMHFSVLFLFRSCSDVTNNLFQQSISAFLSITTLCQPITRGCLTSKYWSDRLLPVVCFVPFCTNDDLDFAGNRIAHCVYALLLLCPSARTRNTTKHLLSTRTCRFSLWETGKPFTTSFSMDVLRSSVARAKNAS